MELLHDFAYPVPALVICELLGAPAGDAAFIARHAPALAARLDPNPFRNDAIVAASDEATVAMTEYLNRLIVERRAHPGSDLLSALITAQEDGDRPRNHGQPPGQRDVRPPAPSRAAAPVA
jgi:cytochrome P450